MNPLVSVVDGSWLEGLMLKLKFQYFGHLMRIIDSLEKTLMLGGIGAGGGDDRGWDGWMASLTRWTWVWMNSGSWWWTGRPGVLQFMGLQRVGHDWATDLIWSEGMWRFGKMTMWSTGIIVVVTELSIINYRLWKAKSAKEVTSLSVS